MQKILVITCSIVLLMLSNLSFEEFGVLFDTKASLLAAPLKERKGEAAKDSANWNINRLDTARSTTYLTDREKDVVLELNKVRTDPKKYAELYLVPELIYYQGKEYRYPGRAVLITNEGKKALEDCIKNLSLLRPMKPLMPSDLLSSAARDHVQDTGPKGVVGHTGSDGSSLESRIKRYGKIERSVAETIFYGNDRGQEIVTSLLVDDGVPNRGHRKIILTAAYDSVGLAIGSHLKYGNVCVIDYAEHG